MTEPAMYNLVDPRADATPLVTVAAEDYPRWLDAAPETARRWLARTGFVDPVPGAFAFLPEDADGGPRVLGVLDGGGTPGWATAALKMISRTVPRSWWTALRKPKTAQMNSTTV